MVYSKEKVQVRVFGARRVPGTGEEIFSQKKISQNFLKNFQNKNYSEHSQSPFTAMESSLALVTTARVEAMLMLKNINYY